MVRLDAVLPTEGQQRVSVDAVRSIDALTTELELLKIELMEHLGFKVGESKPHSDRMAQWYEPYKVFHKHRYCYTDGTIIWAKGDSEFRRKAKSVAGVDFIAMNLYSNAVKYVRRFPGQKTVKTSFVSHADGVEICIESYGPIVMPFELEVLGTRSGVRALSANPYRGMGRGLLRVRNVCKKAGYRVWFTSDKRSNVSPNFALFGAHIFIPEECFMDAWCNRDAT